MGHFDYPSPYWDPVGDLALDLIDRMLTVDPDKRYTIDQCLEHPWTMNNPEGIKNIGLNDSTDGLTGQIAGLDFSKRKVVRERTLLSTLNDIQVSEFINFSPTKNDGSGAAEKKAAVKIFEKNPLKKKKKNGEALGESSSSSKDREVRPEEERNTEEFVNMGGKGDQALFGYDGDGNNSPESNKAGEDRWADGEVGDFARSGRKR